MNADTSPAMHADRCHECVHLGVECPQGYLVLKFECEESPNAHSFVMSRAACYEPDWRFCPHCGSGLRQVKP